MMSERRKNLHKGLLHNYDNKRTVRIFSGIEDLEKSAHIHLGDRNLY